MTEWRKVEMNSERCFYYVSNTGMIKSTSRKYGDNDKLIKPWLSGNGYYYVDINNRSLLLHRLVGKSFLDNPKECHLTIDHIDRNKLNNNVENLRWATHKEQSMNTSRYRHDITETDKIKRQKIFQRESNEKNGYYDDIECECGKIYKRYRQTAHLLSLYHKKRVENTQL